MGRPDRVGWIQMEWLPLPGRERNPWRRSQAFNVLSFRDSPPAHLVDQATSANAYGQGARSQVSSHLVARTETIRW